MGVNVQGIMLSDPLTRRTARLLSMVTTVPPATVALSDALVKEWLRIDPGDTSNNAVITAISTAAVQAFETHTNRALITQTRRATYGAGMVFRLIGAPFGTITAVETVNADGTYTALAASDYVYSADTGMVETTAWQTYGARITYTCGYGSSVSNVPTTATLAMMRYVATNYEIREDGTVSAVSPAPTDWKKIAAPLKIYTI